MVKVFDQTLHISFTKKSLKCPCDEKSLIQFEVHHQHLQTSLDRVFRFSISCLVLEIFRFFETCKLDVSDVIYSRIMKYIYKIVNICKKQAGLFQTLHGYCNSVAPRHNFYCLIATSTVLGIVASKL